MIRSFASPVDDAGDGRGEGPSFTTHKARSRTGRVGTVESRSWVALMEKLRVRGADDTLSLTPAIHLSHLSQFIVSDTFAFVQVCHIIETARWRGIPRDDCGARLEPIPMRKEPGPTVDADRAQRAELHLGLILCDGMLLMFENLGSFDGSFPWRSFAPRSRA